MHFSLKKRVLKPVPLPTFRSVVDLIGLVALDHLGSGAEIVFNLFSIRFEVAFSPKGEG